MTCLSMTVIGVVWIVEAVQGKWCTGEAVNYSAGLGFNGYDEHGRSRWTLLDNAEIYYVEVMLT